MSPEVWRKVSATLDQLLGMPLTEQGPFLDQLRLQDPDVHREVASLSAQNETTDVLESPPKDLMAEVQAALSSPSMAELPAQIGGYQVVSQLGAGGMGVVYEAEDSTLGRHVAIKMLKLEFAAQPEFRARFLREARAVAALQHDHVMPIYHVGEESGSVFLVMPLLKGETLEDRLKRQAELPLQEVLRIGREIAEGLAAAHARGLVHRDIKPANLWLEAGKDRVKIMDFGLARVMNSDEDITRAGTLLGTPAYMAPEQVRGEPVDARADLFSLGCVLYRLCTGSSPFKRNDSMGVLLAVTSEAAIPPHDRNQSVPHALSDFILQLLAKVPAQRTPSAEAAIETLRKLERWIVESGDAGSSTFAIRPAGTSRSWKVSRLALIGSPR